MRRHPHVDVPSRNDAAHVFHNTRAVTGHLKPRAERVDLTWKGGDLSRFAGKPVRFRFRMKVATLYSFWVSKKPTGESGGYVAAGGPDYKGLKDE